MMKFCCLIVITLCTICVSNGGILTEQCLALNGLCGRKGLTCEQIFGLGWIEKGICCNKKPCCGEESKVIPDINHSCGFETTEQCFFRQSSLNDFDWTRRSTGTPSMGTGPESAAEGTYYMYIEASVKSPGTRAVLTTEATDLQACPWCLTFQYHMKGATTGTLEVSAGDKTSSLTSIWTKTGEQPNPESWKTATIDIPLYNNLGITIKASVKDWFTSDIAIDDINLKSGTCTNA
ncbi:MAM domain-containing glycosylphosphatidylinositol anchor protein 1-like [Mytilus trossulus]|uniref:MAM domain-containing glycosylphosphatidylinositol anchor protein 1-like n=1 Tax=Mytilus trossulus TaxID=6551 RepID=UPI00300627BB